MKLGVRAIFGMGHVLALLLHARVARYINESYTSYTSNNNFGYSNAEKAVFRAENWRVLMVLFSRGLLALVIHIHLKDSKYEPIPLIVCSVLGHTSVTRAVLRKIRFLMQSRRCSPAAVCIVRREVAAEEEAVQLAAWRAGRKTLGVPSPSTICWHTAMKRPGRLASPQ